MQLESLEMRRVMSALTRARIQVPQLQPHNLSNNLGESTASYESALGRGTVQAAEGVLEGGPPVAALPPAESAISKGVKGVPEKNRKRKSGNMRASECEPGLLLCPTGKKNGNDQSLEVSLCY